jgi:uncharacterized membrane protein YgcG
VEWLLVILVAGGGGIVARRWRAHVSSRRVELEQLEGVRRLADEDVTYLGEQLQRLDGEVEGHRLDEQTRVDYQTALDTYEAAQRAVSGLRTADEISKVTDTLSSGRYALACVQARVAGRPVPELRVPCFFNPQHGPSVADVSWTRPGHGTRRVPACSQDVARMANDELPEVRTVRIGARTVPYWQAGAAFLPYTEGYFAATGALAWALLPSVGAEGMGAHPGGGLHGDHGGGHGGGHGGFDGGGFGGGGDGGGGGN